MENMGYLLAAYGVIWAVVFAYVLMIQLKQRRLQRQITLLQDSLDKLKTNG